MLLALLFLSINMDPLAGVVLYVFPSIVFPLILIKGKLTGKSILFILLSIFIYFFVSLVAVNMRVFIFTIYAGVAAMCLFILYFLLIDKSFYFFRGIFYTCLFCSIVSVLPLQNRFNFYSETKYGFSSLALFLSVFPLWQTLFAVALKLSAKPNTQNIIQPPSVTTA
jgi:hypothetical protein